MLRRDLSGPVAIGATLLAVAGVAALIVQSAPPRARVAEDDPRGDAARATTAPIPSVAAAAATAPDRPDRLFIALPLAEIRLRTGAFPLALPSDQGTLVRSGWEGPLGPDRWFRGAGVLLDYRIGGASLTLVARQESAARSRVGTPVSIRSATGIAQQRADGALIAWTEGGQRYELASSDLDVAALVRLAAALSAEP